MKWNYSRWNQEFKAGVRKAEFHERASNWNADLCAIVFYWIMQKDKLSLYLSLASVATASIAKGQVQYLDFNPDLELQGNLEFINIDVDQD